MALRSLWASDKRRPVGCPGWLSASVRWLMRDSDLRRQVSPSMWNDERALPGGAERAAASKEGEFEPFMRCFERQILNYLWRMTGEEQTAYDLTQEAFLRAWRHFDAVRQYERPQAWLYRVATNLALRHISRRSRQPIATSEIGSVGHDIPGASDPARQVVESEHVRQALLQLPHKRRAALVLREVYGLQTAEVGKALNMTETAVRMTISRAREQFRALYLAEGGAT
jgi:RNA polymerase sigma-70 factor (ECF subfamily)